jgi:hypothetical protein
MKIAEVNQSLVGKRCRCISFAEIVTGRVEKVNATKSEANVLIRLDEPQYWGNEKFETTIANGRIDFSGSLQYLELI